MNFTEVRGYGAYALLSAKVREAVQGRDTNGSAASGNSDSSSKMENGQDYSHAIYSEPVDTVTISEPARKAFNAMSLSQLALPPAQQEDKRPAMNAAPAETPPAALTTRENSPHIEFRRWLKTSGINNAAGMVSGSFTHKVPGRIMNEALLGSSIAVGDDEEFSIDVDVLSAVTVSERNAEKARAIQNLLNSTPSGINWGMLLATLPPR